MWEDLGGCDVPQRLCRSNVRLSRFRVAVASIDARRWQLAVCQMRLTLAIRGCASTNKVYKLVIGMWLEVSFHKHPDSRSVCCKMFWRKQVLVAMAIAMLTTSVAYAGPMGGRKQQRSVEQQRSRRIASRVQISADRTYAHIDKRNQREHARFDHSPPPQPTSGLDMRKRQVHVDANDALVIPGPGHDHLPGFQGNDNPPYPFPQPKHGHHPTAIAGDAETDPAQLVDVPSVGRKCTKPSTEAEQADTQHLTKRDNGGTPSGPFTRGETSVVITSQLESHPSNKSIFGRCLCGRTLMEEDQGISGICATRFVLSATPTASCKFQGLTSATCVEHGGSENMSEGDDVWWQKAFCKRCRDAGGFSHEWFQCP